ncbi:MAG: DNA helicase, partial [Muribaculaceae bacterium]|nr:DNA helicase [Muribaculaceae bacterium]
VFADIEAVARFTGMVFGCPVPSELRRMFPADRPKRNAGRLTHEYLRIVVNGFTDNLISGSTPSAPGQELLIGYIGDTDKGVPDFSYLRPLLHDGVQLNLIRPRRSHDGILYPELIVYEPDLLTDISAVAGCFETYTTSATVHLLKRLMPPPSGDAINLGNFAGQLLDEIIHNDDSSYAESALRFFRQHALALSAEPPAPQFHSDAKKQIEHIHHAVDVQMPGEVSSFDRTRLMVEPTFFSEMLGLQGRMDFLQLDLKILAEQKSGNGEWPQGNYDLPRMRLPHYVQLLLYMAIIRYNFARQYRDNNEELHAFLMYSRYKQSLLRLGFAPGLLLQAMEIRNRIVADELKFSREGFGFLVTTTAESLNTSGRDTALWKRFTLPKLHQILDPIHNASDTERAYFLRFMRFIAREHILSKTGNRQKEGHGFASTWHDSLEDKLDAGNIYPG